MSLLCWGLQSWMQHPRWGLTRVEQRDRITSLGLVAARPAPTPLLGVGGNEGCFVTPCNGVLESHWFTSLVTAIMKWWLFSCWICQFIFFTSSLAKYFLSRQKCLSTHWSYLRMFVVWYLTETGIAAVLFFFCRCTLSFLWLNSSLLGPIRFSPPVMLAWILNNHNLKNKVRGLLKWLELVWGFVSSSKGQFFSQVLVLTMSKVKNLFVTTVLFSYTVYPILDITLSFNLKNNVLRFSLSQSFQSSFCDINDHML